ncbi:MAG TPA: metallophosphoesterase [Verrucomicrobiae bacterium]|nr:metallophosphoesterase [Verrucomicrobiae bacterium]
MQFPTVSTRFPSNLPNQAYGSEGIPFPDPAGDCTMDLATFFGPAAIAKIVGSGQIIFHSMGDSGVGTAEQETVAEAMARDINDLNHEQGPSFMVHLGDVIYGPNKEATYADKFYRVYDHYNRLIFAVPGNHDGEVFPTTDPGTLAAFKANFCAPIGSQPPLGTQFGVLMPNQPGPYWHLQAPFLDIIGLYSNAAENVGIINNATVGHKQKGWLQARLTAIAGARTGSKRKALVIVVHHPPYARGFQQSGIGHPGSPEMLQDMDDCCAQAGILPDAVLAGHTHSYQHYVRTQNFKGVECTIPYVIVGTGGIGLQRVPAPTGVKDKTGTVLYFSAYKDYGYLTVTASATQLKLEFNAVVATHRELREQITVDLASHKIV